MADAGLIETERLVLRRHVVADLDASAAMWAEPAVTRFIGGTPSTREEAWSRMLRAAGLWALTGWGYWAVCARGSGDFLGEVGFANFMRTMDPAPPPGREIGWAFASRAHGQGYAQEAVAAALRWADAREAGATWCMIDPENTPSLRVAQKAGYSESGRALYKGASVIVFSRAAGG